MARWKFGFPTQPGHWLLLVLAVIPTAEAMASLVNAPQQLIAIAVVALLIAATTTGVAILRTRKPPRWYRTFVLAFVGTSILLCQICLALAAGESNILGGLLYAIALLGLVSGLFSALASSVLDLTALERFDFLHWTGIAVLFAMLAHGFLLWGINVSFGV
jgi:hypothetical protein